MIYDLWIRILIAIDSSTYLDSCLFVNFCQTVFSTTVQRRGHPKDSSTAPDIHEYRLDKDRNGHILPVLTFFQKQRSFPDRSSSLLPSGNSF